MTNLINLLAFDQSTSYTGVFAGTFDLDNPLKAPKVIYWGTVGKKNKKLTPEITHKICDEIAGVMFIVMEDAGYIHAVACEDGFTDPNRPLGGLLVKQAQGWIDGITACMSSGILVHHVFPNSWRTMWGKSHGVKGTEALKEYSVMLAKANMMTRVTAERLSVINDHMADAYFIACWLFHEIVEGRIAIRPIKKQHPAKVNQGQATGGEMR